MIDKIVDWLYMRYGIAIPKKDIVMMLIIILGLLILIISIIFNSGNPKIKTPASQPGSTRY